MITTHEVRDLENKVIARGDADTCLEAMSDQAEKLGCSLSFLVNEVGFKCVNLEEERIQKMKDRGDEYYELLKKAKSTISELKDQLALHNDLESVQSYIDSADMVEEQIKGGLEI